MNRREAISRMALIVGGTLSAQTLSAMERFESIKPNIFGLNDFTLSATHRKILAEVAEHIIPRTDTPGAKDADVPAFIEMMLNDCYKKTEQDSFVEGLVDLEKKDFLSKSNEEQVAMLKQVETDTKEALKALNVKQIKIGDNVDKETMDKKKGVPFWRLVKELTFLGYFTSEKGLQASFIYEPIPGKYEPIKIKKGDKAYYH